MKIEKGKRYIVTDNLEKGNVIEVYEIEGNQAKYRTIKGKEGNRLKFDLRSEFCKGLKPYKEVSIHVSSDGYKTTAYLKENKKTIAKGISKCNPTDEFDLETGVNLALEKVFKNLKKGTKAILYSYITKTNYGVIGAKTDLKDSNGISLELGDVVSIFNKEGLHCGEGYVVEREGRCFVMGISEYMNDFKITLYKKHYDLRNKETYFFVTALKG